MKIHSLLHVPFEDTGCIKPYAISRGHSFSETHLYRGECLPSLNDFDLLVVMGGTMNIYEEEKFPFLSEEKRFIRSSIDSGKKVIGICLGAQLIASVLGADVRKNENKEIGWFDVFKADDAGKTPFSKIIPDSFKVFHWHGDTFDIPDGCVHILKSKGCKNQGFIYKETVIGLQCHPEVTKDTLNSLSENCPEEVLEKGRYIQELSLILDESHIPAANKVIFDILDYLAEI